MDIALIAPPDEGAGSYNRRMARALRDAGHAVTRAAPDGAPQAGVIVIDAMLLPDFADRRPVLARVTTLVHHPAATAPGLSGAERDRLRSLHRALLPLAARVVSSSALVADRLAAEYGLDRARIAVVPPGVDDAPRAKGSGDGCHVVSLGTVTPRKGYDVLLAALARLTDLAWRLTIVGAARPGEYALTIEALAATLGIADRVRLAGPLDDAAMEAVWSSADLFALATRWEAHGTAVAQALRRGVPVAITDGAAAGVDVPVDAGAISTDGPALSRAMRRLILNDGLRRDFADAAYAAGRKLPAWDDQARAFASAIA